MAARVKKIKAEIPDQYDYAQGFGDKAEVKDIPLDVRGNPHSLGDVVPRAFPTVLRTSGEKNYTEGSGRLQLANDIVASPLATRVYVNRVWKWHFGTGIVNTPDNFGKIATSRRILSCSTTSLCSSAREACRPRSCRR